MCWCKPGLHSPHKVKVSGASSYQVLFAKGVNFGKRLYLENGKCYEYRIWIGLLLKPTDSFDVHIVRIPQRSFVQESPIVRSFIRTLMFSDTDFVRL